MYSVRIKDKYIIVRGLYNENILIGEDEWRDRLRLKKFSLLSNKYPKP